jgi:hypothetical protein
MQVELERSGGQLPTFKPKYVVATDSLSSEECHELKRLIEKTNFFRQPKQFSETGLPDAFKYKLTVQEGGQRHSVIFHDEDGHPEQIDAIADWVRSHASHR